MINRIDHGLKIRGNVGEMPSSLFRTFCAVGLAISISGPNPAWALSQTSSSTPPDSPPAPTGCQTWSEQVSAPSPAPGPCLQTLQANARSLTKIEDKTLNQVETREKEILTFGGRKGQESHEVFDVQGEWEVRWESFSDSFVLYLHDEKSTVPTSSKIGNMFSAGKGNYKAKSGGKFYLETMADGPWSIEIVQTVKESSYDYDLTVGCTLKNPFVFPISINLRFAEDEDITLNIAPGQEKLLTQNLLLTDYETKQSDAELLSEIDAITLMEVLNQSPEAIAERTRVKDQAKQEEERKRAEQERITAEERERSNAELDRFAQVTSQSSAKQEQEKSIRNQTLERIAKEEQRRQTLAFKASGVAVMVATIGGAVALLTVGGIGYPDAKKKIEDHDARHANNPDPKFTVQTLRGEYVREQKRYRGMLVGGGILAVAGLAIPTVLFILAGKSSRPSADSNLNGRRAKLVPTFDRSRAGISLVGRF